MWVIAGVLLGIVVLAAILGFHTGPHTHLLTGVAGVVAAIWLVVMALSGRSSSVLWSLFTADLLISAGVGLLAWRALASRQVDARVGLHHRASLGPAALPGVDAVVVTELAPEGVVRVRGEQWTAVAVDSAVPVAAGTRVRVVGRDGMRLEVWAESGDHAEALDASSLFTLDDAHEEAN